MKVKVLFFGVAHDATGVEQEEAELSDGETLSGLWTRYAERFPQLEKISKSILLSVNQDVAAHSTILKDGDEIAILPPVSGGEGGDIYRVTQENIAVPELSRALRMPEDGAVVVFEGIVRNHSRGRRTLYLVYEAYTPMALRRMEEIGAEARRAFAIDRVGMIHRIGRLKVGETSVAIVVAAAHRGPAFEACQYAIDQLKQRVPIWKKEYFEDGSMWAESETQSPALARVCL